MGVVVTLDNTDVTHLVERFRVSSVVNGVGTCTLAVVDPSGALRPRPFMPLTIDVDSDRIFTGRVGRQSFALLIDDEGRSFSVTARDANARAPRVIINGIIPAGTVKAALLAVASNFAAVGVTIDAAMPSGPLLPELSVPWMTGEQFLNMVSTLSGWLWEITPSLVATMWAIGSRSAPATFSAANANIVAEPDSPASTWTEENLAYANAIWVVFGGSAPEGTEKTERFEGDGSTRTFTPRHWVKVRPAQVYDEQTSTYKNVGLKGVDTLFEWVWDEDHQRLEQLTEAPPGTPHAALTAGQFIQTTFAWLCPQAVYVSDAVEIAAQATGDDPGVYPRVETRDEITDIDTAEAWALAQIRRSVGTPQQVTLYTRQVGTQPGDVAPITMPEADLSGGFLVERCDLDYQPIRPDDPEDEGDPLEGAYDLTVRLELVGGDEHYESPIEFWKRALQLGGSSGGAPAGGGTTEAVTPGVAAGRVYADLGGSRSDVVTGATLAQPVPQYRTVYLDPAWFTGGVATVRFEVQSLNAGTSVTPQLRRVDTGAVVAAGSATVSTTWEQQTVLAALPVAGFYRMYLLRGNSSASARGMGALHA